MSKSESVESRFWRRVDKTDGCWVWKTAPSQPRYGYLRVGKSLVAAHRVSYELANGTIPNGLFVCHHCDNPKCVNPAHLFLGTQLDNMRDMHAKGRANNGYGPKGRRRQPRPVKAFCKNGHAMTEENTNLRVIKGYLCRGCRACKRMSRKAEGC